MASILCYRLDGLGIPMGAGFSLPVQTVPEAHPAASMMGTVFFPGVQRRGVASATHPHLAPKLKKE